MSNYTTTKEIKGTTYIVESITPTKDEEKVIKETIKKLILNNLKDVAKPPEIVSTLLDINAL